MAFAPARRAPREARARILVAEDDVDMRELVVDCLRKEGYRVDAVADGGALLARIEHALFLEVPPEPIDLLLTDVQMPGYSGLEVLRGLREAGIGAPFVVMSAFGDARMREGVIALDAYFLDKPFKLEALRAVVRRLLNASGVYARVEH